MAAMPLLDLKGQYRPLRDELLGVAAETLAPPIYAELTESQQEQVVVAIAAALA